MERVLLVFILVALPAFAAKQTFSAKFFNHTFEFSQTDTTFEYRTDKQKHNIPLRNCPSLEIITAFWTQLDEYTAKVTPADLAKGRGPHLEYTYKGKTKKVTPDGKVGTFIRRLPRKLGPIVTQLKQKCIGK